MDLFGKQARQELEQLQKAKMELELRYNEMVAKHRRVSKELQESMALVGAINVSNKSKTQHFKEMHEHDLKAAEFARKSKEIATKEADLLAVYDKKKTSLTKEVRELEEKDLAIKAELADSKKQAKALEKEIQAGESKRDSVAAEIEKLKTGRSNAETALSKAQEKQSELSGEVDKLTRQQDALSKSNLYLNQVVSHLNRHGDDDTVFASLEHDFQRFLSDDRTNGAMQVELKARPLLLVVDLGYDSLNFAAVRAGLVSGDSEISLQFESRKIERGMGCSRFEVLLAGWVWERFSAVHPRLKESVKEQKGIKLSLPIAQRLLALLCQGAPQDEGEETIVIDSEPFSVSVPLLREELVSVFLPLLGPDGELTGAIRRFLAEFKLSVDAIDRVVCMGWYGRLPLVRESLREVFGRPVLVVAEMGTVASAETETKTLITKRNDEKMAARVCVVYSGPEREKRVRQSKLECEHQQKIEKEKAVAKIVDGFNFLDEVVIDTQTDLMWVKDANIADRFMPWHEAMEWVEKLNHAGYRDWRLPTENELEIFAKSGGRRPSKKFNDIGFNNVQSFNYWSGSTKFGNMPDAYCVSMVGGGAFQSSMTRNYYVWPVRDIPVLSSNS